jgi:TonB-dependent SusC/RagA subfamily outer membrane receptor
MWTKWDEADTRQIRRPLSGGSIAEVFTTNPGGSMRSPRSFSRRRTVVPIVLLASAALAGCASRKAETAPSPTAEAAKKPSGRQSATVESANSVDESQFGQQPVNRVEELFIGRFPGVQVLNVDGQMQIRIRSASSFNLSTEPLILVDGQQMNPGSGGLIGLNPRDIHKIEVLKDAVSMAEFGARGSNGVIKITTKRPN